MTLCECCGARVKHHGSKGAFVVGRKPNGVRRVVHNRCRNKWVKRGPALMLTWVENRLV